MLRYECLAQQITGAWYKGDLHAHSEYSDGDSPVADVIKSAEGKGLEFFALSDHDISMRGIPSHWADPAYQSESLVLLYAVEWTTLRGHANIFSASPFDYTGLWMANRGRDPSAAITSAHEQGALFSINHPAAFLCCSWQYPVDAGVDSVEIWNSMYRFPEFNRWAGHQFWDDLLKSGRRIPGIGGSDTHQLKGLQSQLFGHGNPTTWVYAAERTGAALLAGIKAGHVSISYAPDAPRIDFTADADGDGAYETMMGDVVQDSGTALNFKIDIISQDGSVPDSQGRIYELSDREVNDLTAGLSDPGKIMDYHTARAHLTGTNFFLAGVLKNGKLFRSWMLIGKHSIEFADIPAAGTYYRVELIGKADVTLLQQLLYGRVMALTNPIYVRLSD